MAAQVTTRVFVDRSVMFLLGDGEGEVVPCRDGGGYGRLSSVTVRLPHERPPQVMATVRRCRKDGTDDARFKGGNVLTAAKLANEDVWIERAKAAI